MAQWVGLTRHRVARDRTEVEEVRWSRACRPFPSAMTPSATASIRTSPNNGRRVALVQGCMTPHTGASYRTRRENAARRPVTFVGVAVVIESNAHTTAAI